MKAALSLPIYSPSRAEKFTPPQPFMRFLSGDVVSRSRTRMRAIPIFGKNNAAGLISETTQEPSSPKVNCIGQVRATPAPNRRRWRWLKKPLFCYKFPCSFRRYRAFRGILHRWVLCSRRSGHGKKVDVREDSFVFGSNPSSDKKGNLEANVDLEIVPGNALALTRCRSVPRRSSSLGVRIWESTSESLFKTENEPKTLQKFQELEIPFPKSVPKASKIQETQKYVVEDFKGIFGVAADHPLLLTRCKSGPARSA